MAELDLIPDDYRLRISQYAVLRRYSVVFGILIAAVVTCGFMTGKAVERVEAQASELQRQNAITQQQQAQLQQLQEQSAEYERQWGLLRGLRAGAAVEDLFQIVDRALVADELWFVDWEFRRAGVIVDGEQRGVETGYFVIVSPDSQPDAQVDWQVETHMTINGQARDHQALSTFVRALFEQPDIKDVNLQKTSLTSYANGRVVEFDMTIILNSAFKGS